MQHRWEVVLARRQQVADLYCQCYQQQEIASKLGVDASTVSRDLAWCRAQYLAKTIDSMAEAQALHRARIEWSMREAAEAWHKSKEPREVSETEATEGGSPTAQTPRRKAKLRKEGQWGDASLLAAYQHGLDQLADLDGLNAAKRITVDLDSLTDAQLLRLAAGETLERVVAMAEA